MRTATTVPGATRRRRLFPALSPKWAPYVLLSPFVVLFLVFGMFPLGFSLYLAFHRWQPASGLSSMHFVGLGNFAFALHDPWFWQSMRNTLWLAVVAGVAQHVVAIPLAVFLQGAGRRLRDLLTGAYFVPYITSTVAVAILFSSFFALHHGLLNQLLLGLSHLPLLRDWLPGHAIDWLGRPRYVKPAIALVVFWRYVGFNVVLYLAALQTISVDLYEASELDGANAWQRFWYITLPALRPMMWFAVTLSVIGGLQLFDEPFILTGGHGGPDQAGMTAALYFYREAFDFDDFGGASAMSWILFGFIAVLTWSTSRAFASKDSAESEA